jgi:hypothetical protein
MDDSEAGNLEQIRAFLAGSGEVRFAGQRREEVYGCLLVIAGMYVKHRGWILSEIEAAEEFGKRIIVVEPWGQERFPTELERFPVRAGWSTVSIIRAIPNVNFR